MNAPESVSIEDLLIGGPGLLIVLLMLITSAIRVRDKMSDTAWQKLHTTGQYFIWFIFIADLIENYSIAETPLPPIRYIPFIVILILIMLVRLGAAYRNYRSVVTT